MIDEPAEPPEPDADLAERVAALIAETGIDGNADLIAAILTTGAQLGREETDRLDLKITASALAEMRAAFRMFAPYRAHPKVTVFGSARTMRDDPLWTQAHDVAAALAAKGWMVVTGAGPGIMQAATEGAGPDRSMGVSIRLPFEQPNPLLSNDPKHVTMKYFFTRKLMLVKESSGFVAVPGGFGTLDETLELLTLQQTGKSVPTPIVLLDVPGGGYWHGFTDFIARSVASRGLVSADDLDRVLVTDSVDAAVDEIVGFWRNYDSLRWVGDRLVIRLRRAPTADELAHLNERFAADLAAGRITATEPLGPERRDDDALDLPRIVMRWHPMSVGRLHLLVRACNALASAPTEPPLPRPPSA
jgi:uncharacterized protein (TIGR00730 family)